MVSFTLPTTVIESLPNTEHWGRCLRNVQPLTGVGGRGKYSQLKQGRVQWMPKVGSIGYECEVKAKNIVLRLFPSTTTIYFQRPVPLSLNIQRFSSFLPSLNSSGLQFLSIFKFLTKVFYLYPLCKFSKRAFHTFRASIPKNTYSWWKTPCNFREWCHIYKFKTSNIKEAFRQLVHPLTFLSNSLSLILFIKYPKRPILSANSPFLILNRYSLKKNRMKIKVTKCKLPRGSVFIHASTGYFSCASYPSLIFPQCSRAQPNSCKTCLQQFLVLLIFSWLFSLAFFHSACKHVQLSSFFANNLSIIVCPSISLHHFTDVWHHCILLISKIHCRIFEKCRNV